MELRLLGEQTKLHYFILSQPFSVSCAAASHWPAKQREGCSYSQVSVPPPSLCSPFMSEAGEGDDHKRSLLSAGCCETGC